MANKSKANLKAHPASSSATLLAAYDRLHVSATEFINDWMKGDFDLPSLAKCDAGDLKEKCLDVENELAKKKALCWCGKRGYSNPSPDCPVHGKSKAANDKLTHDHR
jgi:hypothetical protein